MCDDLEAEEDGFVVCCYEAESCVGLDEVVDYTACVRMDVLVS